MIRRCALMLAAAVLVACGGDTDAASDGAASERVVDGATTAPSSTDTSTTATSTTDPTTTSTAAPTTSTPPAPLAGRTVVVDPGHNGANFSNTSRINAQVDAGGFSKNCNTTGTAAGDYTESRFNWELAQRVRAHLEALGATVVLTRPDDEGWGPCIDERGLTAGRAGADALVSLHADGADPASSGFHVIHPGAVAGYTDGIVGPSADLARLMRDALVAAGFRPADYVAGGGLVQRSDLGTLNRAGVPAVMLEAGNMRNPADLSVLGSEEGQARLASALTDAVRGFVSAQR